MCDYRYQTIGARFVASVIDSLIFLPLIWVWYLAEMTEALFWMSNLAMFVVSTAYFVILHGRDGQTLGKRFMKVRVVGANDETRISFRQSIWRESPLIAINVILLAIDTVIVFAKPYDQSTTIGAVYDVTNALSYCWIICDSATALFTSKRRSLHDLIGGTVVVNER